MSVVVSRHTASSGRAITTFGDPTESFDEVVRIEPPSIF